MRHEEEGETVYQMQHFSERETERASPFMTIGNFFSWRREKKGFV